MPESKYIVNKDNIPISTTKDGEKERLDVQAKIEGSITVSPNRYRPKLLDLHNDVNIDANIEYTLLDFSGNGQLDFISINCEGIKWEFILEVDGIEIYRLDKNMLKTVHLLNKTSEFIHLETRFVECYPTPIDFITSLKVKVKNINPTTAKTIYSGLVRYREKV